MTLKILIADDERPARYALGKALTGSDYEISEAEDGSMALEMIRNHSPDLVFLDMAMPKRDGLGVLDELQGEPTACEIVVVTADDNVQTAVECIRRGASEYLTKPYEVEQVRAIARRAARRVELQCRLEVLQQQLHERHAFGALVGASRPMRELFSRMQRAARANIDILIRGDTGTGKELIARELHRLSPRSDGPFVAVNTAAIAESLAESELFGHVRGAFTGADADRAGVFEQASGGTLFLDEIGDMPTPTQTKILRALEERAVRRVGGQQLLEVDVRVITATHQDLEQSIRDGHFREDLYYRIRGVELVVPALRHRREDILLLADFFLQQAAPSEQPAPELSAPAIDALLSYSWPGNVRQLRQVVTAATAMCQAGEIGMGDLQLGDNASPSTIEYDELLELPLTEAKSQLVEDFERTAIERALDGHDGNVSAAARQLGIHRQSLQQKMSQLGIRRK